MSDSRAPGNLTRDGGPTPEEITAASQSNLALAFIALSKERRRDISIFYSFCRIVDDLADENDGTVEQRQTSLELWKKCLTAPQASEPHLAPIIRDLIARYQLTPDQFIEIIQGCEMDLRGTTYQTWDDLKLYCHRVASVVGLVSIRIFGTKDPQAEIYARELGLALQLTNIIRDVGHDFREMGRIYLPTADMERFGYTREALATGDDTSREFQDLMAFEAVRAETLYNSAVASFPRHDRRALVAAEIMRRVYHRLLGKMRRDGFRVHQRRYRLSRWEKALCIVTGVVLSYRSPAN